MHPDHTIYVGLEIPLRPGYQAEMMPSYLFPTAGRKF